MEARISGQTLLCQISRSELDRMISGRAIDLDLRLPRNHHFRISVRPSPLDAERGGWRLDSDPTGIWLTIPNDQLQLFGQTKTFAERLIREFPISKTENMQVIVEAIPDVEKEDQTVLEIVPQAEPSGTE